MYKLFAIASLGLAALVAPVESQARVDVGVSIGVPLYGAPHYYAPGPVWQGPTVVYRDYPRPYYAPRYYDGGYYGRPYYRGYRDGYRDHRHDDRHDRGRGRGHDRHDDDHRHRH